MTKFPGKEGEISCEFLWFLFLYSKAVERFSAPQRLSLSWTYHFKFSSYPELALFARAFGCGQQYRTEQVLLRGTSCVTWHQMKAAPAALHDTLNKISLLSGRKVLFTVMTESVPSFVSHAILAQRFVCNYIWKIRVSSKFTYSTCNPRHSVVLCVVIWFNSS